MEKKKNYINEVYVALDDFNKSDEKDDKIDYIKLRLNILKNDFSEHKDIFFKDKDHFFSYFMKTIDDNDDGIRLLDMFIGEIEPLINEKNLDGKTPLMLLFEYEKKAFFKKIDEKSKDLKLDFNIKDNNGKTILEYILDFQKNCELDLEKIINHHCPDLSSFKNREHPIIIKTIKNRENLLQILNDKCKSTDEIINEINNAGTLDFKINGKSFLMSVLENERYDLVNEILNKDINVNLDKEISAHELAINKGKLDIAEKIAKKIIKKREKQYKDVINADKEVQKTFLNSIEKISHYYTELSHYIYELIQNADDNSYLDDVIPSLKFIVKDGYFIIKNNEKGFFQRNFISLSDIGNSTKTENEDKIGEKGIGFKSVRVIVESKYNNTISVN